MEEKNQKNKHPFVDIYNDCFGPLIKRLRLFAYYPPRDKARRKLYMKYAFVNLFVMFVLIGIGEAVSIFLSIKVGDIEKITNDALMFITDCGQYCKFYILIIKNERIQKMARSSSDDCFQPKTEHQEKLIRQNMKSCRRTTLTYLTFAMSTVILWLIYPLVTQTKTDIFSVYVPFDTSYSPVYEIFYIVKGYSLLLHALANTSKDSVVPFFIGHICGQLDVIDDMLRKLKDFAIQKMKDENNERGDLSTVMNELLVECVDRHRIVLALNKELNDVYTFAILAQFTTSVLIICVILYQMSVYSIASVVFFSMVTYLFCMLLQLFIYCWHGNELIIKSANLFHSVYSIDWPETSTAFKKNMLFLMMNVKTPMKVYAGRFFEVSLESYMAILRSSWSYFAVLKNSSDEEIDG